MSLDISKRVWKSRKSTGSDRLALLAVADCANDDGIAYPSMTTIAEMMGGVSRRTAQLRISALAKSKELLIYPRTGGSHDYIVTTGMDFDTLKRAIRLVAMKHGLSTRQLAGVRKMFHRQGGERTFAGGAKDVSQVGAKEPSQGVRKNLRTNDHQPSIKKIKESKAQGAPRPRDLIYDAIVEVCALPKSISGSYVAKTKKELIAIGKTAEDIHAFKQWWYANDWRGLKGQAPTQNQLVTEIEKAKRPATNGHHPDKSSGEINPELAAYLKAKREKEAQNAA